MNLITKQSCLRIAPIKFSVYKIDKEIAFSILKFDDNKVFLKIKAFLEDQIDQKITHHIYVKNILNLIKEKIWFSSKMLVSKERLIKKLQMYLISWQSKNKWVEFSADDPHMEQDVSPIQRLFEKYTFVRILSCIANQVKKECQDSKSLWWILI